MSQMLKSSGAMAAATMTSRLLGMVRELVYASFMGTTGVASAFVFAFNIPNLFRRLLGEGVLSAAFIPIFKAKEKNEGEAEMWRAANAVISGLIIATIVIVVLSTIGVSVVLATVDFSAQWQLRFELLRMMLPYMIFVCLAAIFMGMLNARGHFFIPAMGAAVLNVVMIGSVLFLAPIWGTTLETQIFALAIGVLVAGVAQAGFQLPTLHKEGFRYQWVSPWSDPTVREVVAKMMVGSIGVAAFQINVVVTQLLAFGENERIVAVFQYAVRLMELPQGVFGISLATFLLPTLSALAVEKNYGQFRATLRQGISHLVFVNTLAAILLFTLAEPIIRMLFEHGRFKADSTRDVTFALMCLAPGLLAFSLTNVFARAFYALGEIKLPMRISVFCLALNLVFTGLFLFGLKLGAGALGIANTLSSACNVALLVFALRKQLKTLEMSEFKQTLPAIAACGTLAATLAVASRFGCEKFFGHETLPRQMVEVFAPMTLATVGYFALAYSLRIPSAADILNLFRSRFFRAKRGV